MSGYVLSQQHPGKITRIFRDYGLISWYNKLVRTQGGVFEKTLDHKDISKEVPVGTQNLLIFNVRVVPQNP